MSRRTWTLLGLALAFPVLFAAALVAERAGHLRVLRRRVADLGYCPVCAETLPGHAPGCPDELGNLP